MLARTDVDHRTIMVIVDAAGGDGSEPYEYVEVLFRKDDAWHAGRRIERGYRARRVRRRRGVRLRQELEPCRHGRIPRATAPSVCPERRVVALRSTR